MLNLSTSDSIASFLAINRMIIDYYSVFYLLTFNSSIQERNIRYYLYLIDGIKTRKKVVSDFEKKASKSAQDFNSKKRLSIYEQDEKSIIQLVDLVKKENGDNYVCEKIIESNNWKFIDPKSSKSYKENSYSWVKLYNLAKIPEKYSASFQIYYSTFVHGLGTTLMTNSSYDKMPIICSSLYLTSIIQSLTLKIILIEYKDELISLKLNSDFEKYMNSNWENWK